LGLTIASGLNALASDVLNAIANGVSQATSASTPLLSKLSDLRALSFSSPTQTALVAGYFAAGDPGGGLFALNGSDSTSADNGGTIIVDVSGRRWYRSGARNSVLNVMWFGAKGDGTTDDTAAIQAAITAAITVGGVVHAPPGKYVISGTGLSLSMTSLADNANNRVSIEGAGSGCTTFVYTGTGTCLSIAGTSSVYADYFAVRGIRIENNGSISTQIGVKLTSAAWFGFDDVVIVGFNYGFQGYDVLSALFTRCNIRFNTYGFTVQYQNESDPNALTFTSCELGNNYTYAAALGDATTATFNGCMIENNGTAGNANSGGVFISNENNAILNGCAAATFVGCYFEGNGGLADIHFLAGGSEGNTSLVAVGCTFNRISGTANQFVTNNITMGLGNVSTSKAKLTVVGCSFNGYNSYVPDASRKYIEIASLGALWNFSDGCGSNTYGSNVEKPKILGPVRADAALLSASCVFNGTSGAIISNHLNVASVTRNGTGDYIVNFERALAIPGYSPSISLGNVGIATVFATDTTGVHIQTWNISGVITDFSWIAVNIFGCGDIV
jgi:hypothetical protein